MAETDFLLDESTHTLPPLPLLEERDGQVVEVEDVVKYSEDQPRDEAGRWTDAGGGADGPFTPSPFSSTMWKVWLEHPEGEYAHPRVDHVVVNAAESTGWRGTIVTRAGDGPPFTVGESNMIEGGHYSPSTNTMTVYADSQPPDSLRAIATHEATHGLWHAANQELDAQLEAYRKIVDARDSGETTPPEGMTTQEWQDFPFHGIEHDRIHPALASRFPLAAAYRTLTDRGVSPDGQNISKYVTEGMTVSPYAATWWDAWLHGKARTDQAVNETLAEISAQKERGVSFDKASQLTEWLAFHAEVVKAGAAHIERDPNVHSMKAAGQDTVVIGPEGWGEVHQADGTVRWLRPVRVEKYAPDQDRDERGRFVDGPGKEYHAASPTEVKPDEIEAIGTDGTIQQGACYPTAGRYAVKHSGAVLVHGSITAGGTPLAHAWAEIKRGDGSEMVYDGVQGKFYDKASYYRVLHAVPEHTYTPTETRVKMLRSKHWGPWDALSGKLGPVASNSPMKKEQDP